jgi:hypothetical protein
MANVWKSLPIWAKGVIALVLLGVLIIAGIAIKKAITAARDNKNQKDEADKANEELDNLSNQGINPSFNSADASSKCNSILEAASSCDAWEQGAQSIMGVIYGLKNAADWYLLSSTFGVRTWDDCGWWTGDITGSLTTLLTNELGADQLAEARRHLGQFNVSI